MTLTEATTVLHGLANGIDPVSGKMLPESAPYNHPRVIRALFTALCHLRETKTSSASEDFGTSPKNTDGRSSERVGEPWTPDEDERLIGEFHDAVEFRDMAKMHGRTRGAIVSRLEKLGKIQPRNRNPITDAKSNWAELKKTPSQAGKAWTSDEDASLIRYYDEGIPLEEIAERMQRGMKAVEVRLLKLGKYADGIADTTFDSDTDFAP